MKDDLIQYLIDRAGELVGAVSNAPERNEARALRHEAEELAALADRLLVRREVLAEQYREAA